MISFVRLLFIGTGITAIGCNETNYLWSTPSLDAGANMSEASSAPDVDAAVGSDGTAADNDTTTINLDGGGASGGDTSGGDTHTTPTEGDAALLPDAESYFLTTCAPCHGPNGQGADSIAPNILHPVRDYSTWVVRNGRESDGSYPTDMLAFDETQLPAALLEQIWDFLAAQPQPTTGETLYVDYCSNCHGASADGGPSGVSILGETDDIQDQVRDGNDPGDFEQRDKFMPSFSSAELSDAELDLIAQYVETL